MNDTLKVASRIGAELGAAKAEVDRLRGLLRELRDITSEYAWDADLEARVDAALSQQPEPTDTYTAVDMATAAAQGFRDGQAAVEPAPAQDDRELREVIHLAFEHKLREVNLRAYGEHRGDWRTLTREEMADVVIELLTTRPAQTEQQHPDDAAVDRFAAAMKAKLAAARAMGRGGWDDPNVCSVEFLAQLLVEHLAKGNAGTFEDVANFAMMLHQRGADPKVLAEAAPIAQTAPDSDMRDNYLDLLQEVLDAKEVMRAAGIEQGSFGAMFKQLAKQTAPQPEQSEPNRRTLQWVVDRWHAEVANRPLVNVHRRTLDSTWRQMIRHLGEDDVVLLGPRHDDMLDASGNPLPQYAAALNATQQENSHE